MGDEQEEPLDEEPQGDEPPRPLSREERESVEADLSDLESMRGVFQVQGAKGVVIACTECGANHYYGWELLRESLEHMLETGEPRMHEPPYEPREDEYVVWDYGKGYVDALSDAGLENTSRLDLKACAWCETPLEDHFSFCPHCGRPIAAIRLYRELLNKGIDEREARALLIRAGFEPFS
jgi:predicted nucleic-acid-binding Zn-ribbon protein